MTERQAKSSISKSWDLPHEPAKVWRALTEPDLIAQWLMPNDLRPVPGAEVTFRQEPSAWWDGIVRSRILEVVPQKRLSYTWGSTVGVPPLDTVVTWTLTAIPGGTKLELEHKGFQTGNASAFQGAALGWDRNVGQKLLAVLGTVSTTISTGGAS